LACLLGQGFFFIKNKNLCYKQFGIVFFPKKLVKVVEVILEKKSFPQKIPNISGK
jgi:hypothetical protein